MTLHGKNIVHKAHPDHKLHLELVNEAYTCNSCKEIGFGTRCSCPITACDFHIHDVCVKPPDETSHYFYEKINFTFADGPKNCYCDACGMDINGSLYSSVCGSSRGGHDLHPFCALELETKIIHGDVILFLKKRLSGECELCGLKILSNQRFTWGYASADGEYQFHLHCVKKKLIENWKRISLGLLDPTRRDQVVSDQDGHQFMALVKKKKRMKKGGKESTVNKTIRFAFNLIATFLLGNPTGFIIDIVSMMFQNA